MTKVFQNIDLLKLSGVSSILGIEFRGTAIRIFELVKRGSPLNKFKATFAVGNSFVVDDQSSIGADGRGAVLRKELEQRTIRTKQVVIGFSGPEVKNIEAIAPEQCENVSEWIVEHLEEILKLPVVPDQISFCYQVLDRDQKGMHLRIAFVRKETLDQARSTAQFAGLEIIGICGNDTQGQRSGILSEVSGLAEEYKFGAECALTGFFSELRTLGFLNESTTVEVETKIYKRILQRTAVGLGGVLMVILLLPFLISGYLDIRESGLEEKLSDIAPDHFEVRVLEQQIERLQRQLDNEKIMRSDMARLLYDVSKSSDSGLWLTRLGVVTDDSGAATALISGYARGTADVSRFMRNLQEHMSSSEIRLIRSGNVREKNVSVHETKHVPRSYSVFEVEIKLQGHHE